VSLAAGVLFTIVHETELIALPRRRHMPPPRTNFEKLQDILMKRKGLSLDVSSSGALAASLDKCLVRFFFFLESGSRYLLIAQPFI